MDYESDMIDFEDDEMAEAAPAKRSGDRVMTIVGFLWPPARPSSLVCVFQSGELWHCAHGGIFRYPRPA
jgi:hypothetical protein